MKKNNKNLDFIKEEFDLAKDISYIPNELYTKYDVKKGLRNANGTGVLVLLTKVSDVYGYKIVDGKKIDDDGHLYYRGYDIYDLVSLNNQKYGFERVCFLILFSRLPNDEEIIQFHNLLSDLYKLPLDFTEDFILKRTSPSIMNQIQRCILSLYSYDDDPDNVEVIQVMLKGLSILAKMPSIISYSYRAKKHYIDGKSLHIREPKKNYSIAENLLNMTRKQSNSFTSLEVETLDLALILHADHGGGNNSTFANIVISSTATDIYSSICASIGSLKGPRHGGANIQVHNMMKTVIKDIGLNASDEEIREVVNKILDKQYYDKKGLVYGMGHPVYTKSDPRAVLLKQKCHELAILKKKTKKFEFYNRFETIAIEELKKRKGDSNFCVNIDFYSGLTYEILGINEDLFTPIFACARVIGWLAHNIENKLYCDKIIRPAGQYVGEILEK